MLIIMIVNNNNNNKMLVGTSYNNYVFYSKCYDI